MDLLNFLRAAGIPRYVVSRHPAAHLVTEAGQHGLEHLFTGIIGDARPKSEAIRRICRKEEVDPIRGLYLGDMVFDQRESLDAGTIPVGITTGYHTGDRLEAAGAYIVVNSLTELKTRLRLAVEELIRRGRLHELYALPAQSLLY